MHLSYERVMVFTCNATVNRTWAPCLYLKNDEAQDLSISNNT